MRSLKRGPVSPIWDLLFREGSTTGLTDRELLDRFASRRDPAGDLAFSTLVARHGPMVLGVCRRILPDPSDADDAFQGTFLVLVRKAGTIHVRDTLAPWLYGVSLRVARRVRATVSRRASTAWDQDILEAIPDRGSGELSRMDLRLIIEEHLARLPDNYRTAIVLCHLEGLTHEEAADRIGCPVGTVRSRLARGRALLRGRLEASEQGAISGRIGSRRSADADAPVVAAHLITATARAAGRLAEGHPLALVVPGRLAKVVAGVTRTMMISKLAAIATIGGVMALAAWGVSAGLAAQQTRSAPDGVSNRPTSVDEVPVRLAAAQSSPRPAAKEKARKDERKSEPDLQFLAEFPSVVVDVQPKLGATDVDPSLREIRVTFSKKMKDQNWSWVTYNREMFPTVEGKIHYEADSRTCVLPVKLEPGKTYWLGINSERFQNFKDLNGHPALPYMVVFRTKSAR